MNHALRSRLGLVTLALLAPAAALASSHREAPAIAYDPAADNTDVYAWVEPGTHDKLHVVANWIPLEEPSGGPNFHRFSDDVRYEINIARGPSSLDPVVTYRIRFSTTDINYVDPADLDAPLGGGKEFFSQLDGTTQTYSVRRIGPGNQNVLIAQNVPVAPVNIGPRTDAVIRAGTPYDDAYAATFITDMGTGGNEGRVWAGPRDDGFYVDLGGVFDLANLRAAGTAQDGVSGFNTHAIVLEIPTTRLTANGQAPTAGASDAQTLGIWASSDRQQLTFRKNNGRVDHLGPWKQVSRLGLPLINEAVIGLQDKDRFNASQPKQDLNRFGAYFLNPVVVRDAEAVGIYTALGADPTPFKSNRTDIIDIINLAADHDITTIGDVLRVDMGLDSGFPNGRPLVGGASPNQEQADVTDVLLTVLLSGGAIAVSDGVAYNDKDFLDEMPWLPLPHRGFDEGHGTTTP